VVRMNASDEEDEEDNYGDDEGYPNSNGFSRNDRDKSPIPSLQSLERKDQPTQEHGVSSSSGLSSATRPAGPVFKR
jgi:hypothetical protein